MAEPGLSPDLSRAPSCFPDSWALQQAAGESRETTSVSSATCHLGHFHSALPHGAPAQCLGAVTPQSMGLQTLCPFPRQSHRKSLKMQELAWKQGQVYCWVKRVSCIF